jgi:hypothetical protein
MAVVKTIKDAQGNSFDIINIQNSVGTNAVNNPMDIFIAKTLMRMAALDREVGHIPGLQFSILPSPNDLTTAGLANAIKKYQKAMVKIPILKNHKIIADGRISSAPDTAVRGGVFFTIVGLNVLAKRFSEMMGYKDYTAHYFEIANSIAAAPSFM